MPGFFVMVRSVSSLKNQYAIKTKTSSNCFEEVFDTWYRFRRDGRMIIQLLNALIIR